MKTYFLTAVVLICLAALATGAMGASPGGVYGDGDSWSFSTGENGWYGTPEIQYKFDHLAFQIITPGLTFESTGWTELSVKPSGLGGTLYYDPSWQQIAGSSRTLIAQGNPVAITNGSPYPYMYFKFKFSDPKVVGAQMYWQLWAGATTKTLRATFQANGLDVVMVDQPGFARIQIPEPMSIILGIMGLSSVAGFRKLRRK